jgi:hypothetical protein
MANVNNGSRNSRMKPDVIRIYEDLERWHDHCRFNLLKFDPADLYRSREWREFAGKGNERRNHRRDRAPREQ